MNDLIDGWMNGLIDGWMDGNMRQCIFFSFPFLYSSTPTQRGHMMSCFYNHVPTLVRHKEAVELVELAYNDYANVQQRSLLVQEFYGPQFALFKDGSGQSLGDILSANPEQRTKLIGHMKQALMPLLDKYDVIYCVSSFILLYIV